MRHILIYILMLCATLECGAQLRFMPEPSASDSIQISLLTCAPGAEPYQLEGHSGLRIAYGTVDAVANWGVFDFDSPGFFYRFCKGETDYMIGVYPTQSFLAAYRREHRRVTEQHLNLTRAEAMRVISLVDQNLLPSNRVYRYNYVLDNCATRPVSIIERAVGDSIRFSAPYPTLASTPTFRKAMQHFHANYPWYQFGIDLALGGGIDRVISTRATMFAPVVLCHMATTATIGKRPLVASTDILVPGAESGTVSPPTVWYLRPLTVAMLLLVFNMALPAVTRRRRLFKGWYITVFSLQGIGGCIIAFLMLISVHEATSPNILIFWLNPLSLLVPALILTRRGRRWLVPYMWLNTLACLVPPICAIFDMQVLNPAFYPLILTDISLSLNYLYYTRETSH